MRPYKTLYRGRQFGTCMASSAAGALSVCAVNAKFYHAPFILLTLVARDCEVVDILLEESTFLAQMAGPIKQAAIFEQSKGMEVRQIGCPDMLRLCRINIQRRARHHLEKLKCKI